jgi:hypothetical protein
VGPHIQETEEDQVDALYFTYEQRVFMKPRENSASPLPQARVDCRRRAGGDREALLVGQGGEETAQGIYEIYNKPISYL